MNVISGGSWGITGADVWSQGVMIVLSLAGFLLVRLALMYVPMITEIISDAMFNKKYTGSYDLANTARNSFRRNQKVRSGWYDRDEY